MGISKQIKAKGREKKGCGGEYSENIRSVEGCVFLRVPKRRGDMPVQERSVGIRSHHPFPLSLGCLLTLLLSTFPFGCGKHIIHQPS